MAPGIGILASNFTLGSETLTFEALEERFGAEVMKKVLKSSGIRNRRVATADVCGSDLAFTAAEELLDHHDVDRSKIDLLVMCTQSPDYFLPTTACVLHERLGLAKHCGAFDINLGCSQYIYAMGVVSSMIQSGLASRALVLTGDTMSRCIHPKDRAVVPLMGDAGSATLVGPVGPAEGFLGFELGTDGTGHKYLMIPAGGFRTPQTSQTSIAEADKEGNLRAPENLYMNGAAIFHFGISVVPVAIEKLLSKMNLSIEDVDFFLFHQANKFLLEYLFKKLKIPAHKRHLYLEEVGNTSGSTIPLVMTDAWRQRKLKPGALVLSIAFGVGLSWAASLMRWPESPLGPTPERG